MIEKPVFNPAFRVESVKPDSVFLLSENSYVLLEGPLYYRLAGLLDGRRDADAIVDQVDGQATPAETYYALAQLEKNAYVVEADGAVALPRAAFWHSLGVEGGLAERRLQEATVAVAAFGAIEVGPLAEALSAAGVRVDDDGEVAVAVCDDYLRDGLDEFNALAIEAGRPWLLVKPIGTTVWLGPLFRPGKTACWRCLAQRLSANRAVEGYVQQRGEVESPVVVSRAALSATVHSAYSLAAVEIVKAVAAGDGAQAATAVVTTLDLTTLETQRHSVIRRPQCPACGERPSQARGSSFVGAPIELRSRLKQHVVGGGHRAVPPDETLARYEHHVSSIAGAVTVLKRLHVEGATSIHVYIAGHDLAMQPTDLRGLREALGSRSGGKGITDVHARTSALCEALERYSGKFHGDEPRIRERGRQLGASAIHPNSCMLFSDAQYRDRPGWNAGGSVETAVPVPFDDCAVTDWTPVWSLTARDFKYLPTGYLYYAYSKTPQSSSFWADSNGCAAGNTMEEAVLQGFLELAERDATALWWYNSIRRPAVDLESFDEPYIEQLRRDYRHLDREFWVLDIASDLGIPTFAAVSRRKDGVQEGIEVGLGAHLDPTIGVLRALTELSQSVAFEGQLGAQSQPGGLLSRILGTTSMAELPYLTPDAAVPARRRDDYQLVWSDDLRDDVLRCQEIVEQKGMEMLVLDQTRPDIGLNAVKVIVPGLRHIYPRFAPGRLYEIPMQLGWLDTQSTENDLNPIPLCF